MFRWWHDCKKPSTILEELCKKNHIPLSLDPDNASVYVNGVEYRDNNLTGTKCNKCDATIFQLLIIEQQKNW